jgi:uncharacterized Zn-finger protein
MQENVAAEKPVPPHAVACDGGQGALGHPKVYLSLAQGEAVCPYCGRRFVAAEIAAGAAA